MSECVVTKQKPIEIMVNIPCDIKLYKNLETNRIVGELIIDGSFFGDFTLEKRGMSCTPDEESWKEFFESRFNNYKG